MDRAVVPWRAQITVAGENETLGYFADERTAARAFDARAKELGRHASCNFQEEEEDEDDAASTVAQRSERAADDDDAASTVAQRSERAAEEEEDVAAPTVAESNPPLTTEEWQGDPEFVKFITDRDLPFVQDLWSCPPANSVRQFFVNGGGEDELARALGDGDCEIEWGELLRAWREYDKPPASCFTPEKRARDDDREADGPARKKPAHALFD